RVAPLHPARRRPPGPARGRPSRRRRAPRPRPPRSTTGEAPAMTDRAPDAVARDYILLTLRIDRHLPGTVDGYYAPPDLTATVAAEPPIPPPTLVADARELRRRVASEVAEHDRRHWLDLQLVALETLARLADGQAIDYLDAVTRCFAYTPVRRPDALFDA